MAVGASPSKVDETDELGEILNAQGSPSPFVRNWYKTTIFVQIGLITISFSILGMFDDY